MNKEILNFMVRNPNQINKRETIDKKTAKSIANKLRTLKYKQGYSFTEIAKMIGADKTSVGQRAKCKYLMTIENKEKLNVFFKSLGI